MEERCLMSDRKLPERASLEYLKKIATDRLRELRRTDPNAKLAAAPLAVARDHGFPSWRALKAEIDTRQAANAARFFEACAQGETDLLRQLLNDSRLAQLVKPDRFGGTGLHAAARHGHTDAVRLLLACGADAIRAIPAIMLRRCTSPPARFQEIARYEEGGIVNFGMLAFGKAEFMLRPRHILVRAIRAFGFIPMRSTLCIVISDLSARRAPAKRSRLPKISTTPSTALVNSASGT